MVRTQIQLSEEQSRKLKRLAEIKGQSVAELIRSSVDAMLAATPLADHEEQKRRALALGDQYSGPSDLAEEHDRHLVEAYEA
jgi:hypothetical protein